MRIGINCGHTKSGAGYGAVGLIKESEHTRLVGYALMDKFRNANVEVVDCTIDSANTQNEYLAAAVALANRQDLDWFVSIHFNASAAHTGQGVEVYTYKGRQYDDALEVCQNISQLGFKNRGVKSGSGLYVVKHTKAKAMLIEVCFCDNESDVALYNKVGYDAIAQAIFNALYDYVVVPQPTPSTPIVTENHNMTTEEFIEFVGRVAQKDWQERRLVLPSLVVAQAIKESGWGKSELAQNANALFGIKQNGWTGKLYYKDATEQNADGTYRKDPSTAWRAYDSWEQSIIDHNTYIAERKVGNQTAPNFAEVIGETDIKKAIAGLIGDEVRQKNADNCTDDELKLCVLAGKTQFPYATAQTYAQSLLSDYIQKYNLTRFDVEDESDIAPDGTLYVVQLGAYKYLSNAKRFVKRLEDMGVISMIKNYKVEE